MFRLTAATTVLLLLGATGCSGQETERAEPAAGVPTGSPGRTASTSPEPPARTAPAQTLTLPAPPPATPPLPQALADAVENGPRRARTPGQVAAQIVAAEDAIADPGTPKDVLTTAGHLQQLAYRVLGANPRWDRAVRRVVPARLRGVVERNVESRREFRAMHRRLSDTLPAWRIIPPAPAEELRSYYQLAERRFGVDWEYLAAINLVETGMGRIRGTSVAGAQGPMQFIPSTWAAYGEGDVNSPRDAILAAARYLRARGFNRPGGIPGALYGYNNSRRYVRGVTHLAKVMQARPQAYLGYYHWQIYYLSRHGDVLLPVGYTATKPIPVRRWLAANPQA
jgi:membrane-bound lytic murein transglycosylase B